ncbi:MAG: DUF1156 domain-containing protein [Thermoplasmata archaeon]|nr:DUF1156 domain-containing protein [Thermoplasmata archaeon]
MIERDFPVERIFELALREGNRKKPIYEMHKWWARRLGSNVRAILIASNLESSSWVDTVFRQFYDPQVSLDITVFDPFMGGGTTLVEASKLGARTIGLDIDPVAWFVTKKEIEYCDPSAIEDEMKRIKEDVSEDILRFYRTVDTDGNEVDVIYYFWVDVISCPECSGKFEAHPHFMLFQSKSANTRTVFCKKCHEVKIVPVQQKWFKCKTCRTSTTVLKGTVKDGLFTCPLCGHSGKTSSLPKSGKPLPKRLFALEYVDSQDQRVFRRAERHDLELFQEARSEFDRRRRRLHFPRAKIPVKERTDRRPISNGHQYYHQLFNKRQLLHLSSLFRRIEEVKTQNVRENLLLAFSDCLAANNMLCGFAFGYRKLTPLFSIHSYRYVSRPVEGNVWGAKYGRGTFTRCVKKLIRAKEYANKPYEIRYSERNLERVHLKSVIHKPISTDIASWPTDGSHSLVLNGDSTEMQGLPRDSVDIILTDPPYYDNISYSELSDFYYVWLRRGLKASYPDYFGKTSTPYREAIIVRRPKSHEHHKYIEGLVQVFKNCARVLKDKGIMVFTYHHKKRKAWLALGHSLIRSGFKIVNVFPLRSEGKSGFHSHSGNIKWDCVFVCRRSSDTTDTSNTVSIKAIIGQAERNLEQWEKRLGESGIGFSDAERESFRNSLVLCSSSKKRATPEILSQVFDRLKSFPQAKKHPHHNVVSKFDHETS